MAKIIDEIQLNDTRLLALDGEPPEDMFDTVKIDGVTYKSFIVYDLPKSVAVVCKPNEESLIGKVVTA